VSDEWDCLSEGEVYACVYDPRTGIEELIEGKILITRSPQIHPGDVQFVRAVSRPDVERKLGHLRNVVVFSCKYVASCSDRTFLTGYIEDSVAFHLVWAAVIWTETSSI
jgi:hypothetical protein